MITYAEFDRLYDEFVGCMPNHCSEGVHGGINRHGSCASWAIWLNVESKYSKASKTSIKSVSLNLFGEFKRRLHLDVTDWTYDEIRTKLQIIYSYIDANKQFFCCGVRHEIPKIHLAQFFEGKQCTTIQN